MMTLAERVFLKYWGSTGKPLFGLSIDAERLRQIRAQRRPNSRYASLSQCRKEISDVELLFEREGIPSINTSAISVEEIATTILHRTGIQRRIVA